VRCAPLRASPCAPAVASSAVRASDFGSAHRTHCALAVLVQALAAWKAWVACTMMMPPRAAGARGSCTA
jgi:hypothetical protein